MQKTDITFVSGESKTFKKYEEILTLQLPAPKAGQTLGLFLSVDENCTFEIKFAFFDPKQDDYDDTEFDMFTVTQGEFCVKASEKLVEQFKEFTTKVYAIEEKLAKRFPLQSHLLKIKQDVNLWKQYVENAQNIDDLDEQIPKLMRKAMEAFDKLK